MNCQELATASVEGLNTKCFILNNQYLGMVRVVVWCGVQCGGVVGRCGVGAVWGGVQHGGGVALGGENVSSVK